MIMTLALRRPKELSVLCMGVNQIKITADNQIKAWHFRFLDFTKMCTNVVLDLPLGHFWNKNRFVVHYNGKVSHKQYVATASNS